jgi:hypothetical protein
MLRSRQKPAATTQDLLEVLQGIGQIVMAIDAKLEEVVDILRGEDDEEVDA